MDYDVSFVGGDVIVVRGEVECFVKEVLADGGVEVFNVEANEAGALMVLFSFRHSKHRNSTELSKHIWTLKDNNIEHYISWRILSSHSPYNSSSKRCNLCLKEKFLIIYRPKLSTLNKRNELVSSCRHRNKAPLRNS